MLGLQGLDRQLHLGRLAHEVPALAALGLRGVGRQLHPVDGEHLTPNEPLALTDHEHLGEHFCHRLAQAAHKRAQRAVVRLAIPRKRDELHVVAARPFHAARAHDPMRVGQQHDLEQDPGLVGRSAHLIVAIARLNLGQVDLVIEQVV
jgi:hypothetical protein